MVCRHIYEGHCVARAKCKLKRKPGLRSKMDGRLQKLGSSSTALKTWSMIGKSAEAFQAPQHMLHGLHMRQHEIYLWLQGTTASCCRSQWHKCDSSCALKCTSIGHLARSHLSRSTGSIKAMSPTAHHPVHRHSHRMPAAVKRLQKYPILHPAAVPHPAFLSDCLPLHDAWTL